jgi:predicted phosphodiesterase
MPRIALLSDIHGNLEALVAALRSVAATSPDLIVCLGDVVGYGPEPGMCVELVQMACDHVIVGNHDEAALDPARAAGFNDAAMRSLRFTRSQLTEVHTSAILDWPSRLELEGMEITHGSFGERRYAYLSSLEAASEAFAGFFGRIGAVGHTHNPALFYQLEGGGPAGEIRWIQPPQDLVIRLPENHRFIVNPGSVGQPRDRNPDAAWALVDTDAMTYQLHRVAYDINEVSRKIGAAGLPEFLSERLRVGA